MQHSNATQTSTATADGASSAATQTSTSIIIVVIVIASTIILSTSLYILIRFISRRFRTTRHGRNPNFNNTTILPFNNNNTRIFNSLPLFTFGSLGAKISAGDCAVCLSKFEHDDQLRLLPLCCHAFHADCIDAWLISNQTCPLCRSTVHPSESDVLDKILPNNRSNSFRIEIGSVSRRRTDFSGEAPRSYAIGSFEYIVDEEYEVPIGDARTQTHSDKDSTVITVPVAPGDNLAAEVAGERGSWLRDYVDRIATVSSRSFRSSGRFFSGSSRRTNVVAGVDDLEANNNRFGEEISELFRWLSGV